MPNRLIRDGFVDSESICALSDWTHRVYINLLIRSDDAGRFDGRLEYIRSHLFPLGSSRRSKDFEDALLELVSPKSPDGLCLPTLITRYECYGKPYLQLAKVVRSSPAVTSKFPWRDGSYRIDYAKRQTRDGEKEFVVTSLTEPIGNPSSSLRDPSDPLSHGCTETETETETETKHSPPGGGTGAAKRPAPHRAALSPKGTIPPPGFESFWAAWPRHHRKKGRTKCVRLWERNGLESMAETIVAAVKRFVTSPEWRKENGRFIPGPEPWLNDESWEVPQGALSPEGETAENGFIRQVDTPYLDEVFGALPEGQ